ncbi:peptidase inhibitor family I36 protein [Amycolatopsis pigmentata]|uniref:Peptidase inhibitor family I36 protein n=1 Tax=Amycolatopsis pigmentata TaxID=450801 RepID=A0ABW5G5U9_9PSEU
MAVGIAAGLFGMASVLPADAAESPAAARDGVCDPGEFCYYWGLDQFGSVSDFTVSVSNYGTVEPSCYDFKGPGPGQGQCIKNNAESVWNRSSRPVKVFYNSGFTGYYETFQPGQAGNLDATLINNNASHQFN